MFGNFPDALICDVGSNSYALYTSYKDNDGWVDYQDFAGSLFVTFDYPAGTLQYNGGCDGSGSIDNWETYTFVNSDSGGGTSTSSPYIIDVGSTLMLGGILAFLIAYWVVGLIRRTKNA